MIFQTEKYITHLIKLSEIYGVKKIGEILDDKERTRELSFFLDSFGLITLKSLILKNSRLLRELVCLTIFYSFSLIFNMQAQATECNATYYPSTGEFSVPSIIVDGDANRQTYRANFIQHQGIFTFDLTSVEANNINSVCYKGSSEGESVTGVLENPNDDDNYHIITTPSDSGGGFFTVTVTMNAEESTPWITIKTIDEPEGAIFSGTSGDHDSQTNTVLFEAGANQVYKLYVKDFFNAPTESYPIDYSLTWSFTSTVDCFEPNNTVAEAAEIPLNSTVEAYMLAGYIEGSYTITSDRKEDWYKFTLNEQSRLTYQLLQVPSDIATNNNQMYMTLYDANERQVGSGKASTANGGLVTADLGSFEPGIYYVKIEPFPFYPDAKVNNYPENPIPDHFKIPYKFRVVTSN